MFLLAQFPIRVQWHLADNVRQKNCSKMVISLPLHGAQTKAKLCLIKNFLWNDTDRRDLGSAMQVTLARHVNAHAQLRFHRLEEGMVHLV